MNAHIRNDHEELLERLVGGKLPRNLTWSAVVNLIGQIGEVKPHGNDEFAFVVGSQKRILQASQHTQSRSGRDLPFAQVPEGS